MKDNEVFTIALQGVLGICRAAGATRAELKAMVDQVCNIKKQTQDESEEEWISLVQNLRGCGYDKEWALRQAGPPPREGLEGEI